METLKAIWARIVSAHGYVIDTVQEYPTAATWIGVVLIVLAIVF